MCPCMFHFVLCVSVRLWLTANGLFVDFSETALSSSLKGDTHTLNGLAEKEGEQGRLRERIRVRK